MDSIFNVIKCIDVKDWYYYNQISGNEFDNPFSGTINHVDFINKYFQRGGKKSVLEKFNMLNFSLERAPHTNSVFFLGIYIYNNTVFTNHIDNSLTLKGYNLFPFVWFLTALFHDFGYRYEKELQLYKQIIDIHSLKKELDITYDLLNNYNRINKIGEKLYKSIRNYFYYRRFNQNHSNKIDHGILAGLFYYDALVKNRIEREKLETLETLYWGSDLNKIYAEVAAVIAVHNIWLPKKKDYIEYKRFNLDELIGHEKISINDSPLFVLLAIVDTIDPVKAFLDESDNTYEINELLKQLKIKCNSNKIIFKKPTSFKYDFEKILGRANDLIGWIDVDVNFSDTKDELQIIINN